MPDFLKAQYSNYLGTLGSDIKKRGLKFIQRPYLLLNYKDKVVNGREVDKSGSKFFILLSIIPQIIGKLVGRK